MDTRADVVAAFRALPFDDQVRTVWLLRRDRRVPSFVRRIFAIALIYRMMPIDLIPDPIPGVGLWDDRLVFGAALLFLGLVPTEALAEHVDTIQRILAGEVVVPPRPRPARGRGRRGRR